MLVMVMMVVVGGTAVGGIRAPSPPRRPSPSLRNPSNAPTSTPEGGDALLTCVVRNIGRHTVFWSKVADGKKTILTVDKVLLTSDDRFSVIHDGGDVWVLSLRNARREDSGAYVCQVNSIPPVQTMFRLDVLNKSSLEEGVRSRSNHNFTRCCQLAGVAPRCYGYCSIQTLLDGSVGAEEEDCKEHLPDVIKCMADGRNHVPCCQREGVSDICQELCRGDYTPQGELVKSHFSCAAHLKPTLTCISQGIDLLPRPPISPVVTVLGSNALNISWSHPLLAASAPTTYAITVTPIKEFDPPADHTTANTSLSLLQQSGFTIKRYVTRVPVNVTNFVQKLLKPLTWYEVEVTSENRHGSSLSPYSVRSLTRPTREDQLLPVKIVRLPDINSCCVRKGITHDTCLTKLCNPHNKKIEEPDMILCAPWAQEAFSCLAGNTDHTDCCRARGLPDVCVELCSGNVTKIDYKYFKCVDYFSDYRSCLLKGYGVLPSEPIRVQVSNIFDTHALLSWTLPVQNTRSINAFHSYYRPLHPERSCRNVWKDSIGDSTYRGVYTPQSPFVLENLCPGTKYEIYIQAFNSHGASEPSQRVLFNTENTTTIENNKNEFRYNLTACCNSMGISPGCMALCDYNARMKHVEDLSKVCLADMGRIARCQGGGRNHIGCCERRGVPDECIGLCTGKYDHASAGVDKCNPFLGNIILCLEDGVELLPAPVVSLYIDRVLPEDKGVVLSWQGPSTGAAVEVYQVHYESVERYSAPVNSKFSLNTTMNTTSTRATIDNLKPNLLYSFFVVGVNKNGASLPSSVIHLNISAYLEDTHADKKTPIAAVPSAPHSLKVETVSATSFTIMWLAPEIALPTDRFDYTLHYVMVKDYSSANSSMMKTMTTSTTMLRIENLMPHSQYVMFITASVPAGTTRPSETLLAWTKSAYPAFVETPTVHPTSLIVEGNSVTILCIAMGSPPPTVSLYVAGVLLHQDVTRHMVTVVKNITRNMTDISCYADNGYGSPMQNSVTITISRPPVVTGRAMAHATTGRGLTLRCLVDAWPQPAAVWARDPLGRVLIIHGGNYRMSVVADNSRAKGISTMELEIKSVNQTDAGDYYCISRNPFGENKHKIEVKASPIVSLPTAATACCHAANVTAECEDACDFDFVSPDSALNRDVCVPHFYKLVQCAADGSDHRSCCSRRGVPESCLDWCRQEPVSDDSTCLLSWAPVIFSCFQEGQDTLPGPPTHLRIAPSSPTTAKVTWDPPTKNTHTVGLYRVFWRLLGQHASLKNDTTGRSLEVSGLHAGQAYEIAVKAGNHRGTSVLTPVLTYRHTATLVYSAVHGPDRAGVVAGVVVAVSLVLAAVAAALYVWRRRLLSGKMSQSSSQQSGISFENPSYTKDQNGDVVQMSETGNGTSQNGGTETGNPADSGVWCIPETPGFEKHLKNHSKYARFDS